MHLLCKGQSQGRSIHDLVLLREFDYVVFTTAKPEFFDRVSIEKMFLTKAPWRQMFVRQGTN